MFDPTAPMVATADDAWRKLYEATARYFNLAPWRWMPGDYAIAVEDPAGGETGYCAVMGQMGEQTGLCVYLGSEGYHHFDALVSGELDPVDPASSSDARSVAALFVDRADMPPEDLAVIRRLGLRFRGRGAWGVAHVHQHMARLLALDPPPRGGASVDDRP